MDSAFVFLHAHVPWVALQVLAVVVGALIARRALRAYVFGVVAAAVGALMLGGGARWIGWLAHGARGAPPELEVAGFGALAGLVVGYAVAAPGSREVALDALAPAVGVMTAIARVGCFCAGCDFGAPVAARVPWAVRYPPVTAAFRAQLRAGLIAPDASATLPVHPTQLYEVLVGVVVAACALLPARRPGDRFARAIVVWACGRAVVDVFRGDLARGAFNLTSTQFLAVSLIGALLAWRSVRGARVRADCYRSSRECTGRGH